MDQTRSGPEARGNAPAGPGKLSVADGTSTTPYGKNKQAAESEPALIVIVVRPVANRPGYYEARIAEGEPVIAASRTPFFDAARRLRDLGMDGAAVLVMRHADSNTECLRAIGVAAALTVEEGAHGPVFRRHRTGSSTAVEAPDMRSGDRASTQEPSRTVGGATGNAGTDIAGLLVVRHLDSPTEATTELAGENIVEQSAHAQVFDRHRTSPPSAVGAPCMRSGSRAGTPPPHAPGPTPGAAATAPLSGHPSKIGTHVSQWSGDKPEFAPLQKQKPTAAR
jgi:hypothetical protein